MMITKFMMNGTTVDVMRIDDESTVSVLPPKVYTVRFNDMRGFYLDVTTEKLDLPPKIYGSTIDRVNKCITTYKARDSSTGVLLTGDKGTGKTLLMSLLANTLMNDMHMPVIMVTSGFSGEGFLSFIRNIGECCLLFDEFAKQYGTSDDGSSQESLLTLLDGVDKTKRMVIMTENHAYDINDFILNRPSRIYYHFQYNKLDETSIIGYCADHNVNPVFITKIIDISRKSRLFSFDMLQAIIEEHLRFGEDDLDVLIAELNVDVRALIMQKLEIVSVINNTTNKEIQFTPINLDIDNRNSGYIDIADPDYDDDDDDDDIASPVTIDTKATNHELYIHFSSHLVYSTTTQRVFESRGYTIVGTLVDISSTQYSHLV